MYIYICIYLYIYIHIYLNVDTYPVYIDVPKNSLKTFSYLG